MAAAGAGSFQDFLPTLTAVLMARLGERALGQRPDHSCSEPGQRCTSGAAVWPSAGGRSMANGVRGTASGGKMLASAHVSPGFNQRVVGGIATNPLFQEQPVWALSRALPGGGDAVVPLTAVQRSPSMTSRLLPSPSRRAIRPSVNGGSSTADDHTTTVQRSPSMTNGMLSSPSRRTMRPSVSELSVTAYQGVGVDLLEGGGGAASRSFSVMGSGRVSGLAVQSFHRSHTATLEVDLVSRISSASGARNRAELQHSWSMAPIFGAEEDTIDANDDTPACLSYSMRISEELPGQHLTSCGAHQECGSVQDPMASNLPMPVRETPGLDELVSSSSSSNVASAARLSLSDGGAWDEVQGAGDDCAHAGEQWHCNKHLSKQCVRHQCSGHCQAVCIHSQLHAAHTTALWCVGISRRACEHASIWAAPPYLNHVCICLPFTRQVPHPRGCFQVGLLQLHSRPTQP